MADLNFVVKNGLTVNSSFVVNSTTVSVNGSFVVNGSIVANGTSGAAGEALFSNGTAYYWQAPSFSVNTDFNWTFSNTITFSKEIVVANIVANGVMGSNNQVLASNGTSTYWKNSADYWLGTGNTSANDKVFMVNGQTVNGEFTTESGYNYMSAGPITLNANVTITPNTRWAIV